MFRGGLLLLMVVALAGCGGSSEQWEYMVITPRDEILDDTLLVLGIDGWEVASSRRATIDDGSEGAYELILKRKSSGRKATDEFRQAIAEYEKAAAENVEMQSKLQKLMESQNADTRDEALKKSMEWHKLHAERMSEIADRIRTERDKVK